MDRLQILDTLRKTNPWLTTGKVKKTQLEPFKRREYFEIRQNLCDFNMAELVVGARRVGKSVLMYQLIQDLLDTGIDPKRILFVQGDNPILREIPTERTILSEILEIYQNYILSEKFDSLTGNTYIFIDEAHSLENWQLEVKTLIDLKPKIKFFITGSSSSELRRGSQSPLVGRVKIKILPPFSFLDYFRFFYTKTNNNWSDFLFDNSRQFKQAFIQNDLDTIIKCAKKLTNFCKRNNLQPKTCFDRYLTTGSFPYVLTIKNPEERSRYLGDLLSMTVSRDIITKAKIRDPQAFERLIVNICLNVSSRISYKTLGDKIGIDERSIIKYIDFYVESHWVNIASQYAFTDKQRTVKSEKKAYVIDNGIVNTLNFKSKNEIIREQAYKGHLVENAIYSHLLTFKQQSYGPFQGYIPFWIEEKTGMEIDYIFEIAKAVVPIECKTKHSITDNDVRAIKYFMAKRSSAKFGVITTENMTKIDGKLIYLPYWLFCLLL
tara:strand:+ start:2869 stop:4344 length:1476 start_codon:yes stop_codon:yes gene_type:complete